ncbi:SH3BP2 [Mytilus coruscus]|uniref:SH3BP2 n=1 Tax=Mytilus coruscus TaxID=42192 RepID=A0A6J8CST1_MYTCO|nr:SH3BP2 [Mytilus coruscus]
MNREYDQQSAYSRIRQPFKKIRIHTYMALHKGCVYYYENEYSRTEIEGVSLFGFKSVEVATECADNKALWTFKLVHLHPSVFRSQYFSAASSNDLKFWIRAIENELKNANGEEIRMPNREDVPGEDLEYKDDESGWYQEIVDDAPHIDIFDYDAKGKKSTQFRIADKVALRRSLPLSPPLSPTEYGI